MTTYYAISQNLEEVTEFQGDTVLHPIHQCQKCGHSISPGFARSTGVCGMCHEGINSIGEYLDRIYAVTYYCSEFADHKLTKAIQNEVKKGKYAEEMAEMIEWGINKFDDLNNIDYLVPPPRGSEEAKINHMKGIGDIVGSNLGIEVQDPLRKRKPYTSQKEINDPEERLDNVRDNIMCTSSFTTNPTIIIIDDVVTSTGTLKYSAKALSESGAGKIFGLTISRSEKIDDLVKAEVYTEGDDEA